MSPFLRRALLLAPALLAASASAQEAAPLPGPAVTAHAIEVALDPATGGIEATDRMTVLRNGGGSLALDLRADLKIRRLEVDGKVRADIAREPKDPRPGTARYLVEIHPIPGEATVVLGYGGTIREAVGKAQDLAFVVGDHSGGTISPEGVYLGEGTGWLPLDGSMAVHSVRATVPEGWTVATQGGVPSLNAKDGKVVFTCPAGIPADGLWLQAGKWRTEQRTSRQGVLLRTLLSEGNAAAAPLLLDAMERYLDLYVPLLGPYPHAKFDIVENFFTSGYGMPSATLLGGDVIARIGESAKRTGSIPPGYLDHEFVHGWWGNGVFVDYDSGNWCEALTSYCSNYLAKERESPEEAAKHRRGVRSRFAARVAPGKDYPLRKFTGKTEDFENDIGYGKGSMLFHAVRRAVGDDAFWGALRDVAGAFRGKRASWEDLRRAFQKRGNRNLEDLFRQHLDRTGAPVLAPRDVTVAEDALGWTVGGKVVQEGDPWSLSVPLVVETAGEPVAITLDVSQRDTSFSVRTTRIPTRVVLDPDSHGWRGYARGEVPATLDATLHAEGGARCAVSEAAAVSFAPVREALRGRVQETSDPAGADLLLGFTSEPAIASALAALGVRTTARGLSAAGSTTPGDDVAVLVSGRRDGRPTTVFAAVNAAALAGARRVFYYAGEGTVVFKGGRPLHRSEAEGDESSRVALLDRALPEGSPDRATALVAALCAKECEGRLAGSPAGAKALDLLEKTLRDEDGLKVVRQPFSFEVADWDPKDGCLAVGGAPWPDGRPFCFSASTEEWKQVTPLMLGSTPTLEQFLAGLKAAQEGGAEGILVVGPFEVPEFLQGYLEFPSAPTSKDGGGRRGPPPDPFLAAAGRRARLLMPDFEVKVPVVYYPKEPERSALPTTMRAPLTRRRVETANLFAVIPGSDPALAGEAILLGAHHDHDGPGFPGANDNASGVAAVREAGRILSARRGSLRRPVVLALFGAEEWGLRGSRWFAAHPVEGVPRIACALTLDAVGQGGIAEVNVVGESVYPTLAGPLGRCLTGAGLRKGREIDKYAFAHGSDHYALHEAGIPAVDLFSMDYAIMDTREDTVETVDPAKVAALARAAAAWAIDRSRE